MGEELVQIHHMGVGTGEERSIKCPHCKKAIAISFKTMELDTDTLIFKYGKKK